MTQNDVMQLIIGKDVGVGTPTVSAGTAINTYSQLVDGEVAVVNPHNVVLSAATVLTDDLVAQHGCKLIARKGTTLINSDLIKQNNIISFKSATDAAAVEQVSYIGYNSSANEIEVNNSALYVVRLELREKDINGFGQQIILNAPFKSDSSATQEEVALGIALALSNLLRRQAVKPIKSELVCDRAHTAANVLDYTATVVNGLKSFTIATAVTYNSGTLVVVGDYLRFTGDLTATGTAVKDGIYEVRAIDTLTVSVDRPLECVSGSYTDTDDDIQVIPAASIAVADFGIKLTGIARLFSIPKWRYSKVEFKVGLDGDSSFGDTVVTYTTAMSLGRGTYQQIAELEWDLLGNEGNVYRGDIMDLVSAQSLLVASLTATYDTMSLTFFADPHTEGVGGTPRRQKQLVVAFATGFANGEGPDIVSDVLAAYTTIASGIGL